MSTTKGLESPIQDDENKGDDIAVQTLESNDQVHCLSEKIIIKIGEEKDNFAVKQLKLLPYFRSLLSPRWMKHHKNNSNINSDPIIDVFGDSDSGDCNTPIVNPHFSCFHLHLLLNYIQTGNIATIATTDNESNQSKDKDTVLGHEDIQKLLYCSDFFNGTNGSQQAELDLHNENDKKEEGVHVTFGDENPCTIVTETKVIEYLQYRIPAVSKKDINQWLNDGIIHPTFGKSLTKLDRLLQQQTQMIMGTMQAVDRVCRKINYPSDVAALLFIQRFKLRYDWFTASPYESNDSIQLTIEINQPFYIREWDHLVTLFKNKVTDYIHYFAPILNNMIDNICILHHLPTNGSVKIEFNQPHLFGCIWRWIADIIEELTIKINCNKNLLPGKINLLSMMICSVNLTVYGNHWFHKTNFDDYKRYIDFPNQNKKHEYTLVLLQSSDKYINNLVSQTQLTNVDKQNRMAQWYKFIQHCLSECQTKFICENVNIWFPILYEHYSHATQEMNDFVQQELQLKDWLFKQVTPKFSLKYAFDFGLYLVNYVVSDYPSETTLPQEYSDYIKKVGIEWDIIS